MEKQLTQVHVMSRVTWGRTELSSISVSVPIPGEGFCQAVIRWLPHAGEGGVGFRNVAISTATVDIGGGAVSRKGLVLSIPH